MPCHLSLQHCVYVFIDMRYCRGTRFSTMREITSFYKKSLLHWIENDNKISSPWNRGGSYAFFDRNEGSSLHCTQFYVFYICISYLYSGLWHPVFKALFMVESMAESLLWKETRRIKKRGERNRRNFRQQ